MDICKTIEYNDETGHYIAVVIDIMNGNYVCCFLKKFAYRKWKTQTFSEATSFVINKSFTPSENKMTPFLKNKKLNSSEIPFMCDKTLRKIIWVDDNVAEIILPKYEYKPIINDKKKKDMNGKYDDSSKEYNKQYVTSLKELEVKSSDMKVLVLDTSKLYTCTALSEIGLLPSNVIVPNYSIDEYKAIHESKLCCASYENFSVCLKRYVDSGTKMDSIFIDSGGWINIEPIKENKKRKSQDVLIRQVFDMNALADNCIFAVITSVKRKTIKQSEEYANESCEFIKSYAESKGYTLVKFVNIPYGKRSFYQSYHLSKKIVSN
ncbi:MAG: hypothetical protein Edafosvirus1_108 [Edafosvirus sp.]|uniref:Uncharacterized protein n=1 Tax=Edafosvirus sp. TaxID=2487765 RepID=A0A3G4ZSA3_9VIRU|nr:MAG: hypothetical protein Edafosvirus1_108 [Edafosvirus sp.]